MNADARTHAIEAAAERHSLGLTLTADEWALLGHPTEDAQWMRTAVLVLGSITAAGALDFSVEPHISLDPGVVRIGVYGYTDAAGLARALGLELHTSSWAGGGLGNRHEWAGAVKGVRFVIGAYDHAAAVAS